MLRCIMLFFQTKDTEDVAAPIDKPYWEALMRGQILTATTNKLVNYVNLADQKAQAMIIINSILIPVVLPWMSKPLYMWPAAIAVLTSVLGILCAILCIYPKRRRGQKPDGSYNLLHFSDIGRMKEAEYLSRFNPIYNDMNRLAEEAIKDIHDVSRRIIIPKFFWLKISYGCFFFGNVLAIATAAYKILTAHHI
tara:strand:+ start:228 stop:809 length:582 start_codon:yes stop_codon:yes gene_type:complete